jgi:amino-acid N-acetyltransferase
MGIDLRAAVAADLPGAADVLAECKLAPHAFDRQFAEGFVVAVDEAGRVVGVAGVERYGGDGLFRSAAVRPALQGRGLGERLTRDRIAWAAAQGLGTLYLLTETAAAYWPRFGFRPVPRDAAPPGVAASPEWSGGCPASAVAMALPLAGPARPA